MAQTGIQTASFLNNGSYQTMIKPSEGRYAYKDALGNYDVITNIINKLNPKGSIREDNMRYGITTRTGIRVPLSIANSSSVLTNGNLLVHVSVPTGIALRNVVRFPDIVQDSNSVQGRVVKVNNDTVELEISGRTTAWNAALHYLSGKTMGIVGDANSVLSGGRSSIKSLLTSTYQYHQILRDGHSINSVDLLKPTWAEFDGKYWWNSDFEDVNLRVFKSRANTDWFGQASLTGEGDGAVYTSEGLRDAVILRNPEGYHPLTTRLTEDILQDLITRYSVRMGGNVSELLCCCGTPALANVQKFLAKYIITAGTNNTFGGHDVEGLDITYYAFAGVKLGFTATSIFTDTVNLERSTIQDGIRNGFTMFFFPTYNKSVTSAGTKGPVQIKHLGPRELYVGHIRGIVDKELITNSLISSATIDPSMPVTSLNNSFTYYTYETRSLEINPVNFMLIEYAI